MILNKIHTNQNEIGVGASFQQNIRTTGTKRGHKNLAS